MPKAYHSRTKRQQQRWEFRDAQAQARRLAATRKEAKQQRRRRREAYLHFDPNAEDSADEQGEAAAQRRKVGHFAGVIAGMDAQAIQDLPRAMHHKVPAETMSPAYAPTSPE